MATSVTFNNTTYSIPANREPRGWGTSLSAFLVDVANSSLSKAGGNFTLTADANFGSNFGIVAKYYKSISANIAQSGVVRLANNEGIAWRNAANDGDITFKVNASDDIELGGTLRLDEVTVFSDTDKEMDVGQTLFDQMSSGCSSFDGFTVTGGGTTFTVGAGTGQVVDHETEQLIDVSWSAATGQTPLTSNGVTHVYVTRDGVVTTSLTVPDGTVRRDNIVLGRVGTVSGTIVSATTTTVSTIGVSSTLVDHMESVGAFRINGIIMSPNGANLNINRSAGSIFRAGVNFVATPKDPNVRTVTAASPVTLLYTTSTSFIGNSAVVIPGNYDVGGVVTAIPGSTNQATIQRIYQYPGGGLTTAVQYGPTIYSSLSAAVQAIGTESFTANTSHSENAVLAAILCVTKGCTDLSDTSTARIFVASRFGESSVGASGVSVSTLQNAYNNASDPEIVTDSTRGAVTVRRGSAADTDNVLEVQNAAASTTFSVKGNGNTAVAGNLTVSGVVTTPVIDDAALLLHESSVTTPAAGRIALYSKSDDKLYKKDSAGNETQLATTAEALSNPMTTSGDIIYGGGSGAATRLAANSTATKKWLRSLSSGTPTWEEVDQVKGDTAGTAKASGYVGEAIGTLRSGTNGFSYSGRSGTAPTASFAALASQTINKGIYIVSAASWVVNPDVTTRQYEVELRVGATAVTSTIYVNIPQGGPATLSIPAVPIIISADGTNVAIYGRLNGLSGSVSSTGHEIWITRIA